MDAIKVLVVEDDQLQRHLLVKIIRVMGYEVTACPDAESAWQVLQRESFPIIILDWVLPGMSGLDLCRQIRLSPCGNQSVILVVTGRNTHADILAALDAGADDYIAKPVDVNLLEIRLTIAKRQVYEILKHKQMEENSLETEARFQQITDNINEVFWLFTARREHVIYVNPGYERIWGQSCASLYENPQSWADAIHPQDRPRVAGRLLTEGGWKNYDEEYRVIRPDGSERWVRDRVFPICNELGEVYRVAGIVEDITARQNSTQLQQRLMTAIEQISEVVLITDPEGMIQYTNPAFEYLTGYSQEEVLGKKIDVLKNGNHHPMTSADFWMELNIGQFWHGRFTDQKKDGALFENELTVSAVLDLEGKTINYVAVMRDVTQTVQAEERLRNAQKLEAIGTLAGGIAHDFNNLLTPILGNVAMVMQDLPKESEDYELLSETLSASRDAAGLVQQILAFSRRSFVNMQALDLKALLEEAVSMAHRTFDRKIEFSTELSQPVETITGDAASLKQVLLNLMINSRDALEAKCVRDPGFRPRIALAIDCVDLHEVDCRTNPDAQKGRHVRLSITDNGPGMDAKTREHIFEPFFTTKEVGKGTGLGLASVYGIVRQHNGWIDCQSTLGEGALFQIFLPVTQSKQTPQETSEKNYGNLHGEETLLLIEDDARVLNLAKRALERYGYTVLVGCQGQEGLDIYYRERRRIALIILDLSMPVLSGVEVLRRIRAQDQAVKIIISSGHTADSEAGNLEGFSVQAAVRKPYEPIDLVSTVRTVLDR